MSPTEQVINEQSKSGITETTAIAMISSASIIAMQYTKGGFDAVSEIAVTAFITAAVPFVLRLVHKIRIMEAAKS